MLDTKFAIPRREFTRSGGAGAQSSRLYPKFRSDGTRAAKRAAVWHQRRRWSASLVEAQRLTGAAVLLRHTEIAAKCHISADSFVQMSWTTQP